MEGDWRIPTFDESKELCLNTDIYVVQTNGYQFKATTSEYSDGVTINWPSRVETLKGIKFCKKYESQTYIFIPVSGHASNGSIRDLSIGNLWFSSLHSSTIRLACYFSLGQRSGGFRNNQYRYIGYPVRGVIQPE